jgi:CRISPR-associated protein Csm4
MHYYLYKLEFPYGVHFGADKAGIGLEKTSPNCHCDTLYSAICHEILRLYGEDELTNLYNETVKRNFLLTDLLPYKNNELMIPKPILYKEKSEEEQVCDSVKKKKMKNLQFVPISKLNDFFDRNIEEVKFCDTVLYEKNAPSRDGDDTKNGLYSVGVTKFLNACGLYFIVKIPQEKKEWFDNIIISLGFSGIGGKRTGGYGQFEPKTSMLNDNILNLLNKDSKYYLTLSAFYPHKDEIKNLKSGYYTLIQRNGFVQSATYNDKFLKKIPTTMINAGSCFEQKFNGDVIDVNKDGNHPVYRYGKPIMIGIDV